MPRYVFMCENCKHRWSEFMRLEEYSPNLPCPKCYSDGHRTYGGVGIQAEWSKPVVSMALKVHPSQIDEARRIDLQHGIGYTQYTKDGEPILVSREHRRKYLQAHGAYDRDGGYGDG